MAKIVIDIPDEFLPLRETTIIGSLKENGLLRGALLPGERITYRLDSRANYERSRYSRSDS